MLPSQTGWDSGSSDPATQSISETQGLLHPEGADLGVPQRWQSSPFLVPMGMLWCGDGKDLCEMQVERAGRRGSTGTGPGWGSGEWDSPSGSA